MLVSLVVLSALSAAPAGEFAMPQPGAEALVGPGGRQVVHASGFAFESGARRAEDAAAAFLARYGAAFGVTSRQALTVRSAPALGRVGVVRLGRAIDGLPVFGGDLVLGVDAMERVFVANGAEVPQAPSGRHALGEAAALSAALSSFPGGVNGAGPASVAAGWRAHGAALRAVYRVDFVAEGPPGDWRVFVDGETGATLFREDLRYTATATGSVFEVSPAETLASACPLSGGGHTLCAAPVTATFQNLSDGASLAGAQATVYDCNGANAPTSAAGVPGACVSIAAVNGGFGFPVDPTFMSTTDDFAGAMAYYHLDKHASFLKGLDPTIPPADATPNGQSRALRGSLPGLVNAFQGGAPLDNAFFSGLLDAMVFGQGTTDFAYDATVIYHEFTHGAVFAWGGFVPTIDSLGGLAEPRAVNEGTADAMAVSEIGRSLVGSFVAAQSSPPTPFLRDMSDPDASRTCQGDGTLGNQFGSSIPFINGLDGEVHDDGEIWNGFYWEVYEGLKSAGLKGCGAACEAGPALQYLTLQLAAGTSPTFASYWQTMKAAAGAMFPPLSRAADYVDCVARRRRLDRCDRTVPVYAGESKAQFVDQRYSAFQMVVATSGPTPIPICSAIGTATTLYARADAPVQLSAIDPTTGDAIVTADLSLAFSQGCSSGVAALALPSARTWYLLLDSANGPDLYALQVGPNANARPASLAPPTCVPPSVRVDPTQAAPPPRGSVTFTASGGSGQGYAWSVSPNASGGSVTAAGVYTAGPTGSGISGQVVDQVVVTDSLGNTSFAVVTVGQGVTITPAAPSVAPKGTLHFAAFGGSGTGFTWSLQANPSGGTIDGATGNYTAGSTAGVSDVVQVSDSLGNLATTTVAVTVAAASKSGCGCATGGDAAPALALALAALLRRRARGERRPRAREARGG